jgi:hypothetical protein
MKILKELSIKANYDFLLKLVEELKSIKFEKYTHMPENVEVLSKMIGKETKEILHFKTMEIEGLCSFYWVAYP